MSPIVILGLDVIGKGLGVLVDLVMVVVLVVAICACV